jgi:flavin reductase (DIM6/NTAB) family NADH-FMN oxidoreductase RutF
MVDVDEYRRTAGLFATGVTVVTTALDGTIHGMTANAFTSVSLDPLLVLVCVDRRAGLHALLPQSGGFAVTVLTAEQEDLARHFALKREPGGAGQFDGVDWDPAPVSGAPLLKDGLAWLDCRVERILDGGDHSIFLAEVVDLGSRGGATPLLWYAGRYHRLLD